MRGSLELPDGPNLITASLTEVSAKKSEAISELGRLTEAVFTDPSGLLVILDDYHQEATVAHRAEAKTKLQVTIGARPAPRVKKPLDTMKTIGEIRLGILAEDGAAIYAIRTELLPRTNLRDPFLQMILDSFRSHLAA